MRTEAAGLPVEFAGWVDDIYACMAQLDLLLVPSAGHEATTRVILEAFAAGLPVIAFASGGIPEVVEDGVTGLLANNSERYGPASHRTAYRRRPAADLDRAGGACESWARRFTLERYCRQMLSVIQSAAGSTAT